MPNPFINIIFCIMGAYFGIWAQKGNALTIGLGIATGVSLEAGIFVEHWMLTFVLFFGLLTIMRHKKAALQLQRR
ncbi:hypothetical protein COU89_01770 [Candidatus Roizmanbacteria bacterium CG10_big_fil_rev_8_21_14_0_10_45_7]|uniref:Uncharacterized protein n=1 Tax=Candidatus Roizmanbacteria bacterium CG10_big_fil_rev_8_21_14_0_10_45_7 TaxID=1974854 RepID=A0A2M8KUW8_9BACT|nr:MAG: hypothetical protein COU89_01770 [Candidatus Roizmanbacteria bacterium CG10_big_fil_rev_8_21_14_0_10_45_7]